MTQTRKAFTFDDFNDPDLHFDPDTHTYTYRNDRRLTSVTQIIAEYKQGFDAEAESVKYSKRHGLERAEVLADWNHRRDESLELGTEVHEFAERFINYTQTGSCTGSFLHGLTDPAQDRARWIVSFVADHMRGGYALPEVRICNPEFGVAGTVDLICGIGRDCVPAIVDWKTNRQISAVGFGRMKSPLDQLEDAGLQHYFLQLATYSLLLERYHFKAEDLLVVHLRPGGYELYRAGDEYRGLACVMLVDWTWKDRDVSLEAGS